MSAPSITIFVRHSAVCSNRLGGSSSNGAIAANTFAGSTMAASTASQPRPVAGRRLKLSGGSWKPVLGRLARRPSPPPGRPLNRQSRPSSRANATKVGRAASSRNTSVNSPGWRHSSPAVQILSLRNRAPRSGSISYDMGRMVSVFSHASECAGSAPGIPPVLPRSAMD